MIDLTVNKKPVSVVEGSTVAAAILQVGVDGFRRSAKGYPRGPLCGMGICFECRVTIDGIPQQLSCCALVQNGMEIVTDE